MYINTYMHNEHNTTSFHAASSRTAGSHTLQRTSTRNLQSCGLLVRPPNAQRLKSISRPSFTHVSSICVVFATSGCLAP